MSIKDPKGKFNGKELEYISEYLNSECKQDERSWVQRLEEAIIKRLGTKYAVACNSGTSGLHMAIAACGIGPGDEVIVPALTVVMDPYVVIHQGATPIFADIKRDTYGIDVVDIKRKITKNTKAIITVSLQGLSVDIDPIKKIAKERGIYLIDDSAQNILGEYKGRLSGTLGDINVLSFENKKHITSGSEGGMVLTDSAKLAQNARKFGGIGYKHMTSTSGRTSLALSEVQDPDYERFDTIGLNYRMSEACAAIGLAQFERIDELVDRRIEIARLFDNAVKDCEWITRQLTPDGYKHSHYTYSFEYNGQEMMGVSWKEFYQRYLKLGGDGFYSACVVPYLEPVFKNNPLFSKKYFKGQCPVAEELQKKIMQFKTNYRSYAEANEKSKILRSLVKNLDEDYRK